MSPRLSEKHRPKTFDEVKGQDEVIEKIKRIVGRPFDEIPNIMFIGPAGSGKTSTAECMARAIFGDGWKRNYIEMNSSDERGIDVVRDKIKRLCSIRGRRIILLDEGDNMCLPTDTEVIMGSGGNYKTKCIQDLSQRKFDCMPSVNLQTGEIQEDFGKCIDSGYADFYRLVLEDGRSVTASPEHPFFGRLGKIELQDLSVGDGITDIQERNPVKIISIEHVGRRMKAWNVTMKKNPSFILGNGILTHNTSDAQQALRRIMETRSQTVLILSGNHEHKFIDPIKSRCAIFHFKKLSDEVVMRRLLEICREEGATIDPGAKDGFLALVNDSKGDMRKALNNLDKILSAGKKISEEEVVALKKPSFVGEALKVAVEGDFERAKQMIEDAYINLSFNVDDIIGELYEAIGGIGDDNDVKIRLYGKLSETERNCRVGSNPLIQIIGFMSFSWAAPHLSRACPALKEG